MFLKENSMQDILDLATDKQAAIILSALLNVFQDEKIEAFRKKVVALFGGRIAV